VLRNVVAALIAGLLAACGDGGPSGSSQTSTTTTSAPVSVTLTVVSGETGAPVSYAGLRAVDFFA
jgi:hypothetical protein